MNEKITGGYKKVYAPDHKYSNPDKQGFILEHRMVVENFIGRTLINPEVVHHIDFDKLNNDIDNLMIFPTSEAHSAFHVNIIRFKITNTMRRQIRDRWNGY